MEWSRLDVLCVMYIMHSYWFAHILVQMTSKIIVKIKTEWSGLDVLCVMCMMHLYWLAHILVKMTSKIIVKIKTEWSRLDVLCVMCMMHLYLTCTHTHVTLQWLEARVHMTAGCKSIHTHTSHTHTYTIFTHRLAHILMSLYSDWMHMYIWLQDARTCITYTYIHDLYVSTCSHTYVTILYSDWMHVYV
jgi:hypothetical protein